jgi:flagellar basal body-associated protein FliL
MSEKSKLLFIMLSICGTICILGALIVAAVLFQANATTLTTQNMSSQQEHTEIVFAIFAWGPSFLTLIAGIGMVAFGVRSITKEDRE